ncbi:MAG: carboxylating nicotinate-nucleotide diphosphorylase [Planctomycetes bacterium]|nr:carboxylating nicotinate-nucleotide diphosphorylase [Planctomycetota bacterium]
MPYFDELTLRAAEKAVREALAEDFSPAGDITSAAVVPEGLSAGGVFLVKEDATLAGVPVVEEVCRQVSADITLDVLKSDGDAVCAGEAALRVEGPARALLLAERTSINFLSHLSGVATLTRRFVEVVGGANARILDTRKTLPGLRVLEKYAVRCGGGVNHRFGLSDQVLVKDNHLALMRRAGGGDLRAALAAIRAKVPGGVQVEVEAKTLHEVEAALRAGVDIIMLDNMTLEMMREAVALVAGAPGTRPAIEASGGVTLTSVAEIAATGVDRISIGALTHSAPSIDISLEME